MSRQKFSKGLKRQIATLHVFDGNLTLETFTEFLSTHNAKF